MKARPPCQASSHKSFNSAAWTAYSILPCSLTWSLRSSRLADGFEAETTKPHSTSSWFSCTPMRPALDPAGHQVPRTEPTCPPVRSTALQRLRKAKAFRARSSPAPRKSSRGPYLQYSAKSQSTQRYQSLITKERPSIGPRTLWSSS